MSHESGLARVKLRSYQVLPYSELEAQVTRTRPVASQVGDVVRHIVKPAVSPTPFAVSFNPSSHCGGADHAVSEMLHALDSRGEERHPPPTAAMPGPAHAQEVDGRNQRRPPVNTHERPLSQLSSVPDENQNTAEQPDEMLADHQRRSYQRPLPAATRTVTTGSGEQISSPAHSPSSQSTRPSSSSSTPLEQSS